MTSAFSSITNGLGITKGASAPDAPGIIAPRDFVDNIYGTSVKTVTNPDGTKSSVISVNYSPEDQARLDDLQKSYDGYMADLQSLNSMTAAIDNPAFSPVISALRDQQTTARNDAYKQRSDLEEETLAQRGVADSTSASEVRRLRGNDLTKQASADENQLVLTAEDLRNNAVTRDTQGLTFAANSLQQDKAAREASAQGLLGQQLAFYGADNQIQNANYGLQLAQVQNEQAQSQQIFKNLSSAAGGLGFASSGVGASPLTGASGSTTYLTSPATNASIKWDK